MTTAGIYSAPAARVADPASAGYSRINIWSPKGRLGRVRYIVYSIGFGMLFNIAAGVLSRVGGQSLIPVFIGVGLFLAGVFMLMLLSIQRAHDFDTSGWLAILAFIPPLNFMFWFVPGAKADNRFGKPPPPNSKGVIVVAWIVLSLMIVGVLAAVAIPTFISYSDQAGTF